MTGITHHTKAVVGATIPKLCYNEVHDIDDLSISLGKISGHTKEAHDALGIVGAQGPQGNKGDKGDIGSNGTNGTNGLNGEAGPNLVSTSTSTNITGLLKGNGNTVTQATAGSDYIASETDPTVDATLKGVTLTDVRTHAPASHGNEAHSIAFLTTESDHSIYSLIDGTRAFTGTVVGVTPTLSTHLVTKGYVDNKIQGLDWQQSVLSRFNPTGGLPSSPVTGDRYISTATASGWTINRVYEYNGSTWTASIPNEGYACRVEDEDTQYVYTGSAWVTFGSTVDHGTLSGLSDDDHTQYYNSTRLTLLVLTNLGVEATGNKGAVSGYAGLDVSQKVATANLGGAGADSTKYLRGDQTWAVPTTPVTDMWELDGNSDLEPTSFSGTWVDPSQNELTLPDTVTSDTYWEADGNGDIEPKV